MEAGRVDRRLRKSGIVADTGFDTRPDVQALAATVEPHECTVARGGVVSMRPLLVHASSKSTSAAPRRVLHIEYAAGFDLGSGLELQVA
jgi:hypothetical protein